MVVTGKQWLLRRRLELEAAHPPTGQFVEVQGVRLHVALVGLARNVPGADPVLVLIHGASGNLEDMRLALGDRLASSHRVILIDRPGQDGVPGRIATTTPRPLVRRTWSRAPSNNWGYGVRS